MIFGYMYEEDGLRAKAEGKEEEEQLGEIKFKCPFCDYKTPDLRALKRHCKLKHTEQCPVCGKQYKKLSVHLSKCVDREHMIAYGLIFSKTGYGLTKWLKKCRNLAYKETQIWEPEEVPDDIRENPKFLPELGNREGWLTPLRHAQESYVLKIHHPELGAIYISCKLNELFVEFERLSDSQSFTITEEWHYKLLEKWLKNYTVEFVKKKNRCKLNKKGGGGYHARCAWKKMLIKSFG